MTFINPAILWGLFAVSIPILIHIFNLKKTRKIEFSTLMFLKEIQETKQKRIKLKQLLILLCRIAFIMLLVMAFAGPFSKGFLGSITDRAPATVLVIIDDSFSMSGRSASGSDLDAARIKVDELLNTLDNNDEIFFIPVSKMSDINYLSAFKDQNSVKDSAAKLTLSDSRKYIPWIFQKAKSILQFSKYPMKEIYFITDGQSSMFKGSFAAEEEMFGEDTRLSFILTSNRTPNNVSVDSIDIKTKIFAPSRPVKFNVRIRNHNNFNITNKSITFTSGAYRDEKVLDVPAGTESTADFTFVPDKTGFISGKIELSGSDASEDEFINDNSRYVVFYIPSELKTLIVAPAETDADYVKLAISSSETLTADSTGRQYNFYKIRNSAAISGENLNAFNNVVIINRNSFSGDEAALLKDYIENGGGVILYPGKSSDINNYNEVLNRTLNIPYLPQRTEANVVFEKADFDHPVFEGVFRSKSNEMKLESPSITSYVSPQQGENSQTLITLNSGSSFLTQYNIGKGKMLVYAVAPDNSSSDFPEAGIFAPLTIRSIAYVSKLPVSREAVAGEDYYFSPADLGIQTDSLLIKSAGGISEPIFAGSGGDVLLNLSKYLKTQGVHSVTSGEKTWYEFPLNINDDESVPARSSSEDISDYCEKQLRAEPNVIESTDKVTETVREARSGEMLWQYFLFAAIVFFGIEFWLAKSILLGQRAKTKMQKQAQNSKV